MSALVVSYGGGTNSAAMLIAFRRRGERPDAIVFADTGGEKPRTYGHLLAMQRWCERVDFPALTVVRRDTPMARHDVSLEGECRRLGTLPSRALGFGACSDKWKIDPFEKWLRAQSYIDVAIAIGYHAGEEHRATRLERYGKPCRYPLIEFQLDYDDCVALIRDEGLPRAGKSACFYCPSSKASEILRLRTLTPRYMQRALAMEARAVAGEGQAPALHSVRGLGRRFAWAEFLLVHDTKRAIAASEALVRDAPVDFGLFASTPEECGGGCFT